MALERHPPFGTLERAWRFRTSLALWNEPGALERAWRFGTSLALWNEPGALERAWRFGTSLALWNEPGALERAWRFGASLALWGEPGALGQAILSRRAVAKSSTFAIISPVSLPNADTLARLLSHLDPSWVFGQLWIGRVGAGFEVRHVSDAQSHTDSLNKIDLPEVRALATEREDGAFRPLRLAPDLRNGWRLEARTEEALVDAIHRFYPGALADWALVERDGAERHAQPYREYTNRQTGMYRLTQKLTDEQIAETSRACCHPRFCLKRREWTAPGLPPQDRAETSAIPCLEPCALMLEMARGTVRNAQQDYQELPLTGRELEILDAALERAVSMPPSDVRVGEVARIDNPRRIQALRERLKAQAATAPTQTTENP